MLISIIQVYEVDKVYKVLSVLSQIFYVASLWLSVGSDVPKVIYRIQKVIMLSRYAFSAGGEIAGTSTV